MEFNKVANKNTNGGVTINGEMGVEEQLALDSISKLIFGGIGNINLRSTAIRTASVGQLNSNVSITYPGAGRFIVERYIPSGRKWRFLSVPALTTQTVRQAWMEGALNKDDNPKPGYGMIVTDERTNAIAQGFDTLSLSGPSMKYHTSSSAYTGILQPSDLIGSKQGYMSFVRGDRTSKPANSLLTFTTLRTTGELKRNGQTIAGIIAGDFKAIGNPYPSRINLKSFYLANSSNISSTIIMWDSKLTTGYGLGGFQYLTYNIFSPDFTITPGGGSYGTSGSIMNEIESGQAFFVFGTSAGSVTISETDKLNGSANVFRTSAKISDQYQSLRANLSIIDAADNTTLVDGIAVAFGENADNGVDYTDAKKLVNTNENVSIKRNNNLLSVESRLPIEDKDSIPLNLTGLRLANYQFAFFANNIAQEGRTAFLVDRFLQTQTAINLNDTVFANFTVSNTAGTYAPNRFLIIFKQTPAPAFVNLNAEVNNDKTITAIWQVTNDNAVSKYNLQQSSNGIDFVNVADKNSNQHTTLVATYTALDIAPKLGINYYRVKMITLAGSIYYSNIAKVAAINNEVNITLLPNIITDNIVRLQMNNQTLGNYNIKIIDASGKQIINKNIAVSSYADRFNLALPTVSRGKYYATIYHKQSIINTIAFEVK